MSADFIDIATQSEANARLRDAAPELLAMVKKYNTLMPMEAAERLIAKVEGKEWAS